MSACAEALAALEADPLTLPPWVEEHLQGCPACSEARVAWLAIQDAPPVQVPGEYFNRLPGRILRKLPPRRSPGSAHRILWALAAGLLATAGTGGYLVGRAYNRPVVEATLSPEAPEHPASLLGAPFQEGDDEVAQVQKLSPAETQALMKRLDPKISTPSPQ